MSASEYICYSTVSTSTVQYIREVFTTELQRVPPFDFMSIQEKWRRDLSIDS